MEAQSRASSFVKKTWTGADNQKMIQVARAQLGQTASSLGYTEPWCTDFVTDVAKVAGISTNVIPWGQGYYSANVGGLAFRLEQYGAQEVSVENAKPGDIAIFCWTRKKGAVRLPTSQESMNHAAIVIYYDPETKYLHYVGGNQNPKEALDAGISYTSRYRHVTEVVLDTTNDWTITRVYRPKYATVDYTTPVYQRKVTLVADGSGSVSGDGNYMPGTTVTVKAVPEKDMKFAGWYNGSTLVSGSADYSFEVKEHITLTAKFRKEAVITAKGTSSGSVTGSGTYPFNETVVLTATPQAGRSFDGWYDSSGKKVSGSASYSFAAGMDLTLTALFSGDYFIDVPADAWYHDTAVKSAELGIIKGNGSAVIFDGNGTFTRAMAVTLIARMAGADIKSAPKATFSDVATDAWYASYVNWAYATGVAVGISATQFAPDKAITRQEFITMLERYISAKGVEITGGGLPFKDSSDTAGWARSYAERFYARGLVKGDDNGRLLPLKNLTRSEGAAFVVRTTEYLKSHGA